MIEDLVKKCELFLKDRYEKLDKQKYLNCKKILSAFQKENVSESDFSYSCGYGYNDFGRDKIERIFADIFFAEDALVRSQFISGTHAITTALFAILRPNDKMLCISGDVYDTLKPIIGLKDNFSSLKSMDISYDQIDLLDNDFDYEKINNYLSKEKVKVIYIQRSRGYSQRESLNINKVEKVIKLVKEIDKNAVVMVDNCYCEFVENKNPIEVGADISIGSLIKNLGGGIAPCGGYIVGKKELINLCAERLNVPGAGKEVGPSLGHNKEILMGLFHSPEAVASSLKIAILTSLVLEKLGYDVNPKYNEKRCDIVQTIIFNDKDKLIKYVSGIQKNSAIDSKCETIATDMPGYNDKIIMASGSFISGSSIEFSCDGPIKKPYIAYQQGSLIYDYGVINLIETLKQMQ